MPRPYIPAPLTWRRGEISMEIVRQYQRSGYTIREIAEKTGVGEPVIHRVIINWLFRN